MSATNTPDQSNPISASELRRRLLASAPPTTAEGAPEPLSAEATPELSLPEEPDHAKPGSQHDLLSRLRMPGKSGPISIPVPRAVPSAPVALDPLSNLRPSMSRRTAGNGSIAGALNQLAGLPESTSRYYDDSSHAEIQRIRGENKELRSLLAEMKQLLQEASESEQQLVIKEKEFTAALEEKDAQLNELSAHLGSIEEQIAKGELAPPPPIPKTRTELEEWADELEKESAQLQQARKRIDQERRQLREDEEALEKQMREMEVAMARERAIIARQETELRRLSAEIQQELELMQRGDSSLREHMVKFQRRAQEVLVKPPSGGPPRR